MIGQKGVPATYGGIERHVQELSTRLVARGVPVEVYCRHHYTPKDAELHGVQLLRLPSINTKHLDAITHVSLCAAHAAASKADIVHFHALGPSSLSWLPRLFGKRIVVTVHGLDWRREKWGPIAAAYLRMCEWTATHFSHATIVVSKTLRDHFEAGGGRNVHYIPNGTVLPEAAPEEAVRRFGLEPGRYLLFVGRLVPEKGLHILIQAHRQAVPEWPLIIVGGGHFTEDYVDACRRDAHASVQFLGPQYGRELAALQQHATLVVAPSSLEGLSIALLEAMSFGRAVLGSDIPENLEVLDGVGESFRTGDPVDLGRRLSELLASPERLASMGRGGRERIETEYDWERVAAHTVALYESLLREKTA
jgi:glycosyltransferase involved in cell wall biosynthesis